MLWVISCIAKPDIDALRDTVKQTHIDYLKSQKRILVLSGPQLSYDGTATIGSLFLVNAKSRSEAQAFSDGEPFTHAGVFASVTITPMRKGQWNPEAMAGV